MQMPITFSKCNSSIKNWIHYNTNQTTILRFFNVSRETLKIHITVHAFTGTI